MVCEAELGGRRRDASQYAGKYRYVGQPIHLIAVEFSRKQPNLAAFEVEDR